MYKLTVKVAIQELQELIRLADKKELFRFINNSELHPDFLHESNEDFLMWDDLISEAKKILVI